MRLASKTAVLVLCLPTLLAACEGGDVRNVLPWRQYYAASTAMEPTLPKGTRLWASKVRPEELARGDIVIVRTLGNEDYVSRIVGLPGDRLAMEEGLIILNGVLVKQQRRGSWTYDAEGYRISGKVMLERLPGEKSPHRILDSEESPQDEIAEMTLPGDRYFLISDNRDHAADSRYSEQMFGIGVVRGAQILRRIDLD